MASVGSAYSSVGWHGLLSELWSCKRQQQPLMLSRPLYVLVAYIQSPVSQCQNGREPESSVAKGMNMQTG